MSMEVIFFSNGNTACFDRGSQSPEFQRPWILIFVEWLEEHDVDPEEIVFTMPNGDHARLVQTDGGDGWNWTIAGPGEK